MSTDTTEKGLETLIVRYMTGTDGLPPVAPAGTGSAPTTDVASRLIVPWAAPDIVVCRCGFKTFNPVSRSV